MTAVQPELPTSAASPPAPRRRSETTTRKYQADWDDFTGWCSRHGHLALPATPDSIVAYLEDQTAAGHRPKTVARRASAIGARHSDLGHPNPCATTKVRDLLAAARAAAPDPQGVVPMTLAELRQLIAACDTRSALGARDAALLLVGFAGAYGRSDLVALDVDDLHFDPGQLTVTGPEPTRHIAPGARPLTCPIRAVEHWLEIARITAGPLFRPIGREGTINAARLSDRAVGRIVTGAATRAGIPDHRRLSAHSLRAGWIHTAIANEIPQHQIAAHTGLVPAGTSLTGYSRRAGAPTPLEPVTVGL